MPVSWSSNSLGLWLREVWEPPHTTAGWVVGGVKVRPESKWATATTPCSPPTLDHNVLGVSAGWRAAQTVPRVPGRKPARLKMVGPVTAVLRHLRKAAERGHPRGTPPQGERGYPRGTRGHGQALGAGISMFLQLYLQTGQVDPSSLTAAGSRGQSPSRRPRVSEGLSRRQEGELLCGRRPLPPGHPWICWWLRPLARSSSP